MQDPKTTAAPTAPETPADKPAAERQEPELGYLELLRAPADPQAETDPTDRVLARHRPSAWDF